MTTGDAMWKIFKTCLIITGLFVTLIIVGMCLAS